MEGLYKNAFINSNNLNFSLFINLALQTEISWNELEIILEDLTPTLEKSKELKHKVLSTSFSILMQKQESTKCPQSRQHRTISTHYI